MRRKRDRDARWGSGATQAGAVWFVGKTAPAIEIIGYFLGELMGLKQIQSWARWLLCNGLVAVLAWVAIEGAHARVWNLFRFLICLAVAIYSLGLLVPPRKTVGETHPTVSLMYDFALAAYVASDGRFFWATMVVVQGLLGGLVMLRNAEAKNKNER